ncbi:HD-GYP domain-containing protein [Geomonas sp.]|uniref:HD-GYP domain-containing protein n=1 Tax=Geomonas sp. TaxID=2651584 RepID=UPI002B48F728|nr:HD domain-containing phosphohydrolase [Geomonas sp.]HJV36942.1 HD domain-containing phosphohydrolase [Geomonas sp.]
MAPEDPTYRQNVDMVKLGKALLYQFFVLYKTSFNYQEGHQAIEAPVARVLEALREIHGRREEASLLIRGNHLYLGEYRLKPDPATFEATRFVSGEMRRRRIGRISFSPGVGAEELSRFVYGLREVEESEPNDAYGRVLDRMQQRMVTHVEVEVLGEEVELGEVGRERLTDDRLKARLLYQRALAAMEDVSAGTAAGQPLRFRQCKRVVQHMIDILAPHESCLLALTAQRCRERYSQHHAVNVCILSLCVGRRLGFSKFHLCELGMAALFHDLGKAELPRELLDKAGELSPEEQRALEMHPLYGVRRVMQNKGVDAMTSRIVSGIFEHHLMADHSGYPRLPYRSFSLFGRIISIADSYDALTSSRVNSRTALAPDKAIRFMLTRGGSEFDQGLLKLFIGCVGLHGVGSLLLLDTGEVAVVVANNPDPSHWDQPKVRLIADASGREMEGELLDLAKTDPPKTVIATQDPTIYDLDVSRYLI